MQQQIERGEVYRCKDIIQTTCECGKKFFINMKDNPDEKFLCDSIHQLDLDDHITWDDLDIVCAFNTKVGKIECKGGVWFWRGFDGPCLVELIDKRKNTTRGCGARS